MLKVAKYKNIHIVSISKNEEEKEEAILSNSTKEENTNAQIPINVRMETTQGEKGIYTWQFHQ